MRRATYIIFLLSAIALQAHWGEIFGWEADLAFAALVTIAFFAAPSETALACALAVFLLSWRPGVSREMFVIAAVPVAWSFLTKQIPARRSLTHLAAVAGSIALFYAATGSSAFIGAGKVFWLDIGGSLVFSFCAYRIFMYAYEPAGKGRAHAFPTIP